ncbi:hypothetical protein Pla86_13610 [Planctomycetes bacterium Pla86]|uniref:Uncharacterized protein n=1 Tax=Engelhardtia mirabilis TaxID=2528011 RepID=A0A518BH50_9BACT|nr:hypothetical protein Pla133_13620 [Planctomycetes bacterium Pla133]QDV00621.1 hypothetical protein Pla86_13610 [Planctomycetes bacterium Pla86]
MASRASFDCDRGIGVQDADPPVQFRPMYLPAGGMPQSA